VTGAVCLPFPHPERLQDRWPDRAGRACRKTKLESLLRGLRFTRLTLWRGGTWPRTGSPTHGGNARTRSLVKIKSIQRERADKRVFPGSGRNGPMNRVADAERLDWTERWWMGRRSKGPSVRISSADGRHEQTRGTSKILETLDEELQTAGTLRQGWQIAAGNLADPSAPPHGHAPHEAQNPHANGGDSSVAI